MLYEYSTGTAQSSSVMPKQVTTFTIFYPIFPITEE